MSNDATGASGSAVFFSFFTEAFFAEAFFAAGAGAGASSSSSSAPPNPPSSSDPPAAPKSSPKSSAISSSSSSAPPNPVSADGQAAQRSNAVANLSRTGKVADTMDEKRVQRNSVHGMRMSRASKREESPHKGPHQLHRPSCTEKCADSWMPAC